MTASNPADIRSDATGGALFGINHRQLTTYEAVLLLLGGVEHQFQVGRVNFWLSGISRGQGIGLPNLLGVRREEPEQVRDPDTSSTQTPRDPNFFLMRFAWRTIDQQLRQNQTLTQINRFWLLMRHPPKTELRRQPQKRGTGLIEQSDDLTSSQNLLCEITVVPQLEPGNTDGEIP